MDPEKIIQEIGGFGRYQQIQYFLFSILWTGCGIQAYLSIFILYTPPFRCAVPGLSNDSYSRWPPGINDSIPFEKDENGHMEYSHCHVYEQENLTNTESNNYANISHHNKVSCDRWVYDKSQMRDSATTQMDFVCDKTTYVSIMNMLYMVGVFFGSYIFGIMADKKGRKPTLYLCIVLYISSVLPIYIIHEPIALGVFRTIAGAASQGVFMTGFILAMEMVSCSQRSPVGLQAENFFAVGEIMVVTVGYFTREWHLQSLCVGIIYLPCLAYWFFLQESPRWLISTGRIEEAKKLFTIMAKKNKVPLPNLEIKEKPTDEKEEKKAGLKDLFKSRILLVRSLIIFFNWAVINMVYYGLMFNSGNLSDNLYISALLSGLVEFPAYTLLIFTMDRWGRKPLFCGLTIFSGVSCIASALVNIWFKDIGWLSLTLALSGKFAISSSFAIMYNMTTELFPTVVRNAALGISSCAGRAGSIAAPYITLAGTLIPSQIGHAMPLVLFGGFALVGGLLSLLLPETLGRNLPETIEDGEKFGREPKRIQTEVHQNKALNVTETEQSGT